MLLPEFMYGTMKEVKSNCLKISRKLKNGVSWEEAVSSSMLETDLRKGFLILYPQGPFNSSKVHYYIYLLLNQIYHDKLLKNLKDDIFYKCLETDWGTLSLIAYANHIWLHPETKFKPFLKSVLRFWDLFIKEDQRYVSVGGENNTLWAVGSSLLYVLANMGVPTEVLKKPLPDGNLKALIDKCTICYKIK